MVSGDAEHDFAVSRPLTLLTLHCRHEVFGLLVTPEAFVVMEKVSPLYGVYCQVMKAR
jgi:hypothetical protein